VRTTLQHRIVLAIIAVTLLAASAGGFHAHSHDSSKACQVCHAAHLPALTAVAHLPGVGLGVFGWRGPELQFLLYSDPLLGNSQSRGPPFSS